MAIRYRVRALAEAKGWNISTLHRRSGLTLPTVRRYWYETKDGSEHGEPLHVVDTRALLALAGALGVRPSELFEDVDAEELQAA